MSVIEANIIIDAEDRKDLSKLVSSIESIISQLNGKNTHVTVNEVDDPLSFNPTRIPKTE